jgi:sulfofructose kinase
MRNAPVVCLGATVFDRVLNIDRLPTTGIKMRALSWTNRGGGPAATAAVCIGALGLPCRLWSRVGDDHEGADLLKELAERGVDVRHTRIVAGQVTSTCVVILDGTGERLIIGHPNNLGASTEGLPTADELASGLRDAGAVLTDTSWPEGASVLFRAARERGLPGVLDGDLGRGDPGALSRLASLAKYSIFSEVGWHIVTGSREPSLDALRAVQAQTGTVPSVTLGTQGSWWLIDGALRHVPARRVPVRDTTGAGDVFHGAFAAALAMGRDVLWAAEFATATAALKCQLGDGWRGMPDRIAIERLMREQVQ